MPLQRLCQQPISFSSIVGVCIAATWAALWPAAAARGDAPVHDYPTAARVEYVNECIANQRDSLANVYQCSCVIDRIANTLSYDAFVEAITFARYAGLPGEGGAIFRDSDQARKLARQYKELEAEAYKTCGLRKP
jgi:hypothetical protein